MTRYLCVCIVISNISRCLSALVVVVFKSVINVTGSFLHKSAAPGYEPRDALGHAYETDTRTTYINMPSTSGPSNYIQLGGSL